MDVQTWINKQLLPDTVGGMRVGQSYLVRVRPEWHNPKLFHETNVTEAWKMIWEAEDNERSRRDLWKGY